MRYYIRINFLPEPRDDAFLAGRCIKILHGVIKRYGWTDIAVAFPEWSEQSIGSSIAFVSYFPEQLSLLITQKFFKEMGILMYFEIQPLKPIIDENEQVAFVRNQSIDQGTAVGARRRLKRLVKRAEQRGEVYIPNAHSNNYNFGCYHKIPIISKETGRCFSLYIERQIVHKLTSETVNTYGLSTKIKPPISVPKFLS